MWLQNVHLKKQEGSEAHSRAVIQKVAPFHIYIKFAFLIPRSDFTSRAMCNKNSCLNNLNPQIRRVTSTLEERVQRSQEQRAGASKFSTSFMLKLVFAVKEAHVLVCFVFFCRIQSGSYLSTGWFTLILAMDMCKEIHVYGMINDTYCK